MSRFRFASVLFACRDRGDRVTRILYTAQEREDEGAVARFMGDCQSDCMGRDETTGSLGVGPRESCTLTTNKSRRSGRFVQRLIELDRELYERYANIGARGEPSSTRNFDRRLSQRRTKQMKRTNETKCSCCGQSAQYSVASVISTRGVRPRRQQCSPAVVFCESCIRELCDVAVSPLMQDALKSAYTAIKNHSAAPCEMKEEQ